MQMSGVCIKLLIEESWIDNQMQNNQLLYHFASNSHAQSKPIKIQMTTVLLTITLWISETLYNWMDDAQRLRNQVFWLNQ